jgi:hypothetical protein
MPTDSKLIREVWANNLETEMKAIRNIVEEYPWVSMVILYKLGFFTCLVTLSF